MDDKEINEFIINVLEEINPEKSLIDGPGLKTGFTGEVSKFTINMKDIKGNEVKFDDENFTIEVDAPTLTPKFNITKENDTTICVDYLPKITGTYEFEIKCNNNTIPQGKYKIDVNSQANPFKTYYNGDGLKFGKAKKFSKFLMKPKNDLGDLITENEENAEVQVDGPDKIIPKITASKDGYYIDYVPNSPGDYLGKIKNNYFSFC
jgi:hypothetical protein